MEAHLLRVQTSEATRMSFPNPWWLPDLVPTDTVSDENLALGWEQICFTTALPVMPKEETVMSMMSDSPNQGITEGRVAGRTWRARAETD